VVRTQGLSAAVKLKSLSTEIKPEPSSYALERIPLAFRGPECATLRTIMHSAELLNVRTMPMMEPRPKNAETHQKGSDIFLASIPYFLVQVDEEKERFFSQYISQECPDDTGAFFDEKGKSTAGEAEWRMEESKSNPSKKYKVLKFVMVKAIIPAITMLTEHVSVWAQYGTVFKTFWKEDLPPVQYSIDPPCNLKEGELDGNVRATLKLTRLYCKEMHTQLTTNQAVSAALKDGKELVFSAKYLRLQQYVDPKSGKKDPFAFETQNYLTIQGPTQLYILGYLQPPTEEDAEETLVTFNPPVLITVPLQQST
jgi:hypothetical protein